MAVHLMLSTASSAASAASLSTPSTPALAVAETARLGRPRPPPLRPRFRAARPPVRRPRGRDPTRRRRGPARWGAALGRARWRPPPKPSRTSRSRAGPWLGPRVRGHRRRPGPRRGRRAACRSAREPRRPRPKTRAAAATRFGRRRLTRARGASRVRAEPERDRRCADVVLGWSGPPPGGSTAANTSVQARTRGRTVTDRRSSIFGPRGAMGTQPTGSDGLLLRLDLDETRRHEGRRARETKINDIGPAGGPARPPKCSTARRFCLRVALFVSAALSSTHAVVDTLRHGSRFRLRR